MMNQDHDNDIINMIKKKLNDKLEITLLDLKDKSHLHSHHNEKSKAGKTHFVLTIAAKEFNQINLLNRHRMLNKILEEEMKVIYSLKIRAYTTNLS